MTYHVPATSPPCPHSLVLTCPHMSYLSSQPLSSHARTCPSPPHSLSLTRPHMSAHVLLVLKFSFPHTSAHVSTGPSCPPIPSLTRPHVSSWSSPPVPMQPSGALSVPAASGFTATDADFPWLHSSWLSSSSLSPRPVGYQEGWAAEAGGR
jgi:hypothetical protein